MENCRVCLQSASIDLFITFISGRRLSDMLAECGGVQIAEMDSLPRKICAACLENLVKANDFRSTCKETDEKLRLAIQPKMELTPEAGDYIIEEYIDHEEEQRVTNERQIVVIKMETPSVVETKLCQFINQKPPERHQQQQQETRASGTEDRFVCNICGAQLKTKAILMDHKKSHDKKFLCPLCTTSYATGAKMNRHVANVHQNPGSFVCGTCNQRFNHKRNLERHEATHKPPSFRCDLCSAVFKTKEYLQIHLKRHEKVKKFACDLCPRRYADFTDLKRHKLVHLNLRNYPCETCSKAFFTSKERRMHERVHFAKRRSDKSGE